MADISVTHSMLAALAARCCYEVPESGLVFFGFRGMLPLDPSGTGFAAAHRVRLVTTDNVLIRCTLGQWRPADGTLALFPGSTVPNRNAIASARQHNGIGANMLMPGKYAYERGVHKVATLRAHRAFRQGMFFPVWRSSDDLDFDLRDRLDTAGIDPDHYPWDNLHCAHHDNLDTPGYSSNGCQVVAGRPTMPLTGNKPETGPWARFITNAYGPDAQGQTRFAYLLFSGSEAGMFANQPDGAFKRSLRFGSAGEWVVKVQQALRGEGFPFLETDGGLGRNTLEALMAFQGREFGAGTADGIVGTNTAGALGIEWPTMQAAAPAQPFMAQPLSPPVSAVPDPLPADWRHAALEITPHFESEGDPYQAVSGDFDGMGISCGVLQWNIGSNSLQPMVRAAGQPAVTAMMPTLGAQLWNACKATASTASGLAIVRAWQNGTRLKPVAAAELRAFMDSAAMRAQQDGKINEVAATALIQAKRWAQSAGRAGPDKREFAWFFDLTTQNGGLKGLTFADIKQFIANNGPKGAQAVICDFLDQQNQTSGHGKDAKKYAAQWRGKAAGTKLELLVLSYLRSGKSNPLWRHVVLNRKGSIAMSGGWVNSSQHDFTALLD